MINRIKPLSIVYTNVTEDEYLPYVATKTDYDSDVVSQNGELYVVSTIEGTNSLTYWKKDNANSILDTKTRTYSTRDGHMQYKFRCGVPFDGLVLTGVTAGKIVVSATNEEGAYTLPKTETELSPYLFDDEDYGETSKPYIFYFNEVAKSGHIKIDVYYEGTIKIGEAWAFKKIDKLGDIALEISPSHLIFSKREEDVFGDAEYVKRIRKTQIDALAYFETKNKNLIDDFFTAIDLETVVFDPSGGILSDDEKEKTVQMSSVKVGYVAAYRNTPKVDNEAYADYSTYTLKIKEVS